MNKLNNYTTNEEMYVENDSEKILSEAENIILSTEKNSKKLSNSKKFLLFFVLPFSILSLLLLALSTFFALSNVNNFNILDGVFIQGVDVSGLSKDEATAKVSSLTNACLEKSFTVSHEDYETTILANQFCSGFDISSAIEEAYLIGRSGNIFENNFTILNTLLNNRNISLNVNYDTELLNSLISDINSKLPDRVEQPSYYVNEKNLIITSGKDGVLVDSNQFTKKLLTLLLDFSTTQVSFSIPVTNVGANSIDIDNIYSEIHKEPVDAYFTTNPYSLYPSSNGIDFAISLDEAKKIILTYMEEYTIPLKTIAPNITTNQLGNEAFPDLLSSFSTSFSSSNSNRSTNIKLSASKINGCTLLPGESFSYNQVVGKRTAAAGFKEATAYLNGQVIQEYGGGICQVSSTLYNAVLYANLEITERSNHGFKPSYVKPGLDATVSWGGPDFKFKNNRNYPIRIVCDTSGKTLRIYIYGLKTEDDYTVKLEARYLSTVYATTTYKTDSSLASGESKVLESGSNGCKTATYKYLYDKNGTLVSSECISRDTYNPHNKVVAVSP